MDKNVEALIATEVEVNKKVKAALEAKTETLKSIKREVDVAMKEFRKEREAEFEVKIKKVKTFRNLNLSLI